MNIIQPFQRITELVDDDEITKEIASFPKDVQKNMYQLVKELLKDELYFVVNLEKYKRRPLRKATLQ